MFQFISVFALFSSSFSFTKRIAVILVLIFRLDALAKALSVIATATWLGGWLGGWVAGWMSHSGTVSKRLNLSENFFDHLKAASF